MATAVQGRTICSSITKSKPSRWRMPKFVKTIIVASGKETAQAAQEARRKQSEAEDMVDCGCCFDKFAHNRVVHCEGGVGVRSAMPRRK